ncbi:MAG: cytochrome P450 [Chloroflexota bacterium]
MTKANALTADTLPRADWRFVAQNIRRVRGDRMGIFTALLKKYGDAAALRLGPVVLHVFGHPEHAQHILQTNQKNYRRDHHVNEPVKLFTGQTMFTTDGEPWLRQRRLMQPAFHRRQLTRLAEITVAVTDRMLTRWREAQEQPLDMQSEMTRTTLEIIGLALFSAQLTGHQTTANHTVDHEAALGQALLEGNEFVIYQIDIPITPPLWVPTPRNQRFNAAMREIDSFLYSLIDDRTENPMSDERQHDLIDMLLNARDEESGEGMSKQQVRNEMVSLFSAGHETTANALTWTLYLLSQHPDEAVKVQTEVDTVLGDRLPTADDLTALLYTRQVIEESLRLYPPAWALVRESIEDDVVGGWTVPAGGQVTIAIAEIHRHPEYWDAPNEFRPERFAPEQETARHRFAYMPFGGGPRQCIGKHFALTEATLILAMLMQRVECQLAPDYVVQTKTIITLHARDGLPMNLVWR